ncbi:M20 family peptidase [Clostridium bowmanii]|uniref:M20 family peptidase n=1 Tax=Clostridium bowmanii TaxID=132925 RepID=UPI001C0E793F|nr:M20 family peptidase [Clostridium bowmanii]MBU3189134.1 M20 family peptidase [Clostridium bowmanii]MCA1073766.1 M20 family peptidase [Clostridium bowmanii]
MKQEIISYISSIEQDIYNLSYYLYTNPESSYKEYKGCSYIINMLKSHDFKVQENYCNIPTSFYAQYGNGHPKICYICKYTSTENVGHIFGNNVNASISTAAALGLSKVISKIGGSVILLGCPGEYSNGAELSLTKENCLEDIDIIIAPHCDINNAESGTSLATIPIKIKYNQNNNNNNNNNNSELSNLSSLDTYLFILNTLSLLIKGLNIRCSIDTISIKNASSCPNSFSQSEVTLNLTANTLREAKVLEKSIGDFTESLSKAMNIIGDISLFELPSEELLSNKSLSRLFTHNLKECGVIDIAPCKNARYGLGIGSISHITPCIYPSISITEDATISCPSPKFALETQTDLCKNNIIKSAKALAITGLDIIEKQDLLKEIMLELK